VSTAENELEHHVFIMMNFAFIISLGIKSFGFFKKKTIEAFQSFSLEISDKKIIRK